MKKIAILILVAISQFSFAQSNAKWSRNGDNTSTGDWLGTTNSQALLLKSNNTTGIKILPTGEIVFNSIALNYMGPNGLVFTDLQGKIFRKDFTGNTSDVLLGDGTWGSPIGIWKSSGNDLYWLAGNVGIGITPNPLYKLDVLGDAHISNNLYVGGGIVITDKVDAAVEVKAGDMIVNGIATFNGALKSATLAGVGDRSVYVDAGGNFKTIPPPAGFSSCAPAPPNWHLGGDNISTFVQAGFDNAIGTCDNADFILKANGNQKIWIKNTGEIGFGTASPTQQFHFTGGNMGIGAGPFLSANKMLTVNGDVCFANYASSGNVHANDGFSAFEIVGMDKVPTRRGISTEEDPNGDLSFFINGNQSSGSPAFKFKNGYGATSAVSAPDILTINAQGLTKITGYMAVNSTNALLTLDNFNLTGNKTVFETKSDGSTHIGLNSPFTVLGNGSTNITTGLANQKMFSIDNTAYSGSAFEVLSNGLTTLRVSPSLSTNAFAINNVLTNKTSFQVQTDGLTQINIPSSIPSINAPSAIEVSDLTGTNFKVKSSGFVYAREVQIMVGTFPDYVFEKSYRRLSLPDLNNYIVENKRLPGFEKAEYYIKNGINTSEMFIKQQEKIEELTLYNIELEKRISALEKSNK